MSTRIHLGPSVLAADFTRLGQQIHEAEAAGADYIHIDVMDGRFVPNITMGPLVVEAVRRATTLPLDVHLMIVEPELHLEAFSKAGANTLHVHWETGFHLHRTLQQIKALGCRAGLAVNPHTPASILSELLHSVDVILVMTVNPGFGGQALIPETLDKARQIKNMIQTQRRPIDLMVDGGINSVTAPDAVKAGANMLVCGSAVFSSQFSVSEGIARLRASTEHLNTI